MIVENATYLVPVQGEELISYASFAVKVKIRTRGTITTLKYELPLEISGEPYEIQVKISASASNPSEFSGPYAKALCSQRAKDLVCHMDYRDKFKIDLGLVDSFLRSLDLSPLELSNRQSVARVF